MTEIKRSQDGEENPNSNLQNHQPNPKYHFRSKFISFLKSHTIYEAIPPNMKILVFNSRLTIKRAITGMIKEDISCSLIYNTETQKMNGILGIRDIISLLAFINDKFKPNKETIHSIPFFIKEIFNKNISINTLEIITEEKNEKTSSENQSLKSEVFGEANEIEEDCLNNKNGLFDQENKCLDQLFSSFSLISITDYINQVKGVLNNNLFTISLDDNLYEGIREISKNDTHRLVIEDMKTKKFCGFITYETVFDYYIERYYSDMDEFNLKATEMNLLSTQLITLNKNDSIYNCFELCLKKKISFVPIYDQDTHNELFGFVYLKDFFFFFSDSAPFSVSDILLMLIVYFFIYFLVQ